MCNDKPQSVVLTAVDNPANITNHDGICAEFSRFSDFQQVAASVVKELLGHEDIKTTMIYAMADARLLRDAIRSFENLGKDSYTIVTRNLEGEPKILEGKL